jgi:ABC-2 type transport system permease protein
MPMRYLLGGASWLEVGVSMAILVACNAAAIWVAARIYRVGILMYGKRPSMRELARWLRY